MKAWYVPGILDIREKISLAHLLPCMAFADSCMQCNNPTGSFSFCSLLPSLPFSLLAVIYHFQMDCKSIRGYGQTIYDSLLQMCSTFHFH